MKILVLHPEGTLNYNANLFELLELMGEHGHQVTYTCVHRGDCCQDANSNLFRVVRVPASDLTGPFLFPEGSTYQTAVELESMQQWGGFDLIIGVDAGVIEASWIARHSGAAHALLSYEIFFADEISPRAKALEIEACRDISFAICQDGLRSRKLCLEQQIAPAKILHIPVAGRRYQPATTKPRLLHRLFDLPDDTKIALHIGSFEGWTHAHYLLESTKYWPDDWVLVIHERYGRSPETQQLVRNLAAAGRVKLSGETFDNFRLMKEFIQSADAGIALYRPMPDDKYLGQNMKYVGLSSGKISSYLQHGIPVITHDIGELSDWIRFYGAGLVAPLDTPLRPMTFPAESTEACRTLFETHLDLERFGPSLIERLASLR
jgi:O-antigen biosynthesis protein